MIKRKNLLTQSIGVVGTLICISLFVYRPSFPTPDKILVVLILAFMIFGDAWEMFKRVFPFVAIMFVYESFRGIADQLNRHIHYLIAPRFDHAIFGNLPTIYLQDWWWRGRPQWYDYALYLPYLLHFVLPLVLALVVWKTRVKYYWQVVGTYLVVAFGAFLTYFLLPAAPPWLASQNHYIPPITRISSQVWAGLGLSDFPSAYNQITPNQVAAIPSLHAAWASLLLIFVYKIYGRRWALLAAVYPFAIFVGTIYEGEHYAFDVILGIIYAVVGYLVTPSLISATVKHYKRYIGGHKLLGVKL